MKNNKIMALVMATIMGSFFFGACTEKEDFDNLSTSVVEKPNIPTPQLGWNDSIIGYQFIGSQNEIELITLNGMVIRWGNPFAMSGNAYVRQGTVDLSSTQSNMAVSANPILWPYNHSITDNLGRINDTVIVTMIVGNADSVETRTFRVAPIEPLKVYMEISHVHPTGTAGFVDQATMNYTLATASSVSEWGCKWSSKATIYEKEADTIYVDTTTRRKVDEVAQGYHRAWLGNWSGTGNTRTISGTNTMVVTSYYNMAPMTVVDSASYGCSGTLTVTGWHTYTQSMNGRYYFDNNGNIPELGIHATTSWNRGPAYVNGQDYTAYAPLCKHNLGYVDVNGTTATVVTYDGEDVFTANWPITIDIPTQDSTVVNRSVAWRHLNDCGQWSGNGATRTITIHCWCVETTVWSTGSVTKDSVLVAGHGTMTWNFPSYTSSQDGSYTANANGCNALGATCTMSWTYDVANIQGRTYTHTADCSLIPNGINVVGTTATVTTAHGATSRTAGYTITINTPTPADTINHFDGKAVMWSITATYFGASPSDGMAWYINVITLDNGVYTWYTAPYSNNPSLWSFTNRGTVSSTVYNHLVSVSNYTGTAQTGAREALALCANGYVISTVKYDPNGSQPDQVKYYSMTNSLIAYVSAVSGTIGGGDVVEPVQAGVNGAYFTVENTVIK